MKMRLNFKKFSKHPPTMVGNVYLGSSSHNENYLSLAPCPYDTHIIELEIIQKATVLLIYVLLMHVLLVHVLLMHVYLV